LDCYRDHEMVSEPVGCRTPTSAPARVDIQDAFNRAATMGLNQRDGCAATAEFFNGIARAELSIKSAYRSKAAVRERRLGLHLT
jgi:hypothetical protein